MRGLSGGCTGHSDRATSRGASYGDAVSAWDKSLFDRCTPQFGEELIRLSTGIKRNKTSHRGELRMEAKQYCESIRDACATQGPGLA